MGQISRIRVVDVPYSPRSNKTRVTMLRILESVNAGLSPNEALEMPIDGGQDAKAHPSAGGLLVGKLNQHFRANKMPVDCFRRVKDNHWYLYVVGR